MKDMRISFGIDVKEADFEKANRILGSLKDKVDSISITSARIGTEGSRGFAQFAAGLKTDELSKATGGIKELVQSIDFLSKSSSSFGAIIRNFTSMGRAINDSVAGSQVRLIKELGKEIEVLDGQSSRAMMNQSRARELAMRAESMGNSTAAARYNNYAEQQGLNASQYSSLSWQGRLASAARTPFMGTSLIGAGGAVAMGLGLGAAALTVGGAAYDLSLSGVRGDIAHQQYEMGLGRAAAGGDPTRLILQSLGVGQESAIRRGGASAWGAGSAAGANVLRSLLSVPFGGRFIGFGEAAAAQMGQAADLDTAKYGESIGASAKFALERSGQFDALYRQSGLGGGDAAVLAMTRMGISTGIGGGALNAMARYGYGGVSPALALAQRRLGLSAGAIDQLARQGGGGVGDFSRLVGGTGANTIAEREAVSDLFASQAAGVGGRYNISDVSGFSASMIGNAMNSRNITGATGLDAIAAGATTAQTVQGMAGAPGNVVSAMDDQTLLSLGVKDPLVRFTASQLIASGQVDRAVGLIARNTGKSAREVRAALSSSRGAAQDYLRSMFSGKGSKDLEAEGISPEGMLLGDLKTASTGGFKGNFMDPFSAKPAAAELGGLAITDTDIVQGGVAQNQTAMIQAQRTIEGSQSELGDVTPRITKSISEGFTRMALEIKQLADEVAARANQTNMVTGPKR